MAFKGSRTPDFAGIAMQKLQVALAMRAQRQREEDSATKQRLAKLDAVSKARAASLDEAKKQIEIQKSLSELSGLTMQAQDAANQEFTPQDVNAGSDTQAFGQILSELDPQGVARANQAQQVLADRVGTAARAQQVASGSSPSAAVDSALGAAQVSRNERALERQAEAQDVIDKEVRKAQGKALAVPELIKSREAAKKSAKAARRAGDSETAALKAEEARVIDGMIEQREKGILGREQPIPLTGRIIESKTDRMLMARRQKGIARTFIENIQNGKIRTGAGGKAISIGLRAGAFLDSLSGFDDRLENTVRSALVSAGPDADTVTLVDEGLQLSVGLDELALAYAIVRGNRDSARFTVLELERVLGEFETTGLFTSKPQLLAAAKRAFSLNAQVEAESEAFLSAGGVDPNVFQNIGISSSDQSFLNSIDTSGSSPPSAAGVTSTPAPAGIDFDSLAGEILQEGF